MRFAIKPLDSFTAVGYGNTAQLQMDVGPTYEEIVLNMGNINVDQVLRIEVILNGEAIVAVTGQHLKDLDTHLGMPSETGTIRIPFRDVSLDTDAGQMLSSLVTLPTDNLVLKVRIDQATTAQTTDGDVPSISGYSKLAAARKERRVVPKMYTENIAIGMTGENNYKTYMTGPAIRRVFFEDGGRMTDLRIKMNDKEVFDMSKTDAHRLLERFGLHGVTNQYVFAPVQTGFGIADMMQTAGVKLEVMPTVNAAGDMSVVIHELQAAGNPKASPLSVIGG